MAEQTKTQREIEQLVTNGLGYDTRTRYVEENSGQFSIASYSQIHDTPESLRAHLGELDAKTNPSRALNDLIKTYKDLAIDMAELPYTGAIGIVLSNSHITYHPHIIEKEKLSNNFRIPELPKREKPYRENSPTPGNEPKYILQNKPSLSEINPSPITTSELMAEVERQAREKRRQKQQVGGRDEREEAKRKKCPGPTPQDPLPGFF